MSPIYRSVTFQVFMTNSHCDLDVRSVLAGLIASVGKGGRENDIKMVENLVISYISKPSCVILATVACESQLFLFIPEETTHRGMRYCSGL